MTLIIWTYVWVMGAGMGTSLAVDFETAELCKTAEQQVREVHSLPPAHYLITVCVRTTND